MLEYVPTSDVEDDPFYGGKVATVFKSRGGKYVLRFYRLGTQRFIQFDDIQNSGRIHNSVRFAFNETRLRMLFKHLLGKDE